jgi:hypothetical protein
MANYRCQPDTDHEATGVFSRSVLLCWLALLLVRVVETTTDRTWPKIRAELDRPC